MSHYDTKTKTSSIIYPFIRIHQAIVQKRIEKEDTPSNTSFSILSFTLWVTVYYIPACLPNIPNLFSSGRRERERQLGRPRPDPQCWAGGRRWGPVPRWPAQHVLQEQQVVQEEELTQGTRICIQVRTPLSFLFLVFFTILSSLICAVYNLKQGWLETTYCCPNKSKYLVSEGL